MKKDSSQIKVNSKMVSVAPMLDWTDRHERHFLRLITKQTWLYSEMITTGALIHGNKDRYLKYNDFEHPVALQLGGSNPQDLSIAAKMGEDYGYKEINLNCGCPSSRVQSGDFGAALMAKPELVSKCVESIKNTVDVPVSVKCRLGVDENKGYEDFREFVRIVKEGGCEDFIVHARHVNLNISPKDNREKLSLHYDFVYRLKEEYPDLMISINGDIKSVDDAQEHLKKVDGVMLGRVAYHKPFVLSTVDRDIYGSDAEIPTKMEVLEQYMDYVDRQVALGVPLKAMTKHILGIFPGEKGSRSYRRHLSDEARRDGADSKVIREALKKMQMIALL